MTTDGEDAVKAIIDAAADDPVELKDAGLNQRDALLMICDEATVWRSPEGDAYASVPCRDHVEHHAIGSRAFRHWLLHRLASRFTQNGRPASANDNAVRDARNAVEARAIVAGVIHPAPLRLAEHNGEYFLDLGTPDWSAARITATGWSIVPQAPLPILRSKRAAPFASPATRGDFSPLRHLLRHLDDDDFILFVAWCLGALLPAGPYPILVLGGEHGSGKSTLARLAQLLVDPVNGNLLQPPGDDRDLIAAAKANRVMSFDNLSGIRAELADSLCRLATGSEIGGRALYSDHDLASFVACRPLVVNGIPDLAARSDLADRAIVLRLRALAERITERDWRAAVETILPQTFAAFLDALCIGISALDRTPTPDVRMADFARFIVAAEPALPWPPGAFLAAYQRSRLDATFALADGDPVASAILGFMNDTRPQWTGLISELYRGLSVLRPTTGHRSDDWPGNARWFSDRLRRAAPALRALGIDVTERRAASGTLVTLRRVAPLATSAAPETAPRRTAAHGANGASVATGPLCTACGNGQAPISGQANALTFPDDPPPDFPNDFGKNGGV